MIGFVVLARRVAPNSLSGGVLAAALLLAPLGSLVQGGRVLGNGIEHWESGASPDFSRRGNLKFNNYTRGSGEGQGGDTELDRTLGALGREPILVAERAAIWRFWTRREVLELPQRIDRDALERLVGFSGGAYVMLPVARATALIASIGMRPDQVRGINVGPLVLLEVSRVWLAAGAR